MSDFLQKSTYVSPSKDHDIFHSRICCQNSQLSGFKNYIWSMFWKFQKIRLESLVSFVTQKVF